jgi:cytochrome b561
VHLTNTISEYGFISKLFHWLTALLLFVQIPLGFYLVDLDFGKERINFENIHVIIGLSVFYLAILRLLNNFLIQHQKLKPVVFFGQKFIARLNHVLLYLSILTITISGILKKLFNGEKLNLFFKDIQIQDNFDLAEQFYDIHIIANYTLIALLTLHIFAVIIHRYIFKENILKKMI